MVAFWLHNPEIGPGFDPLAGQGRHFIGKSTISLFATVYLAENRYLLDSSGSCELHSRNNRETAILRFNV